MKKTVVVSYNALENIDDSNYFELTFNDLAGDPDFSGAIRNGWDIQMVILKDEASYMFPSELPDEGDILLIMQTLKSIYNSLKEFCQQDAGTLSIDAVFLTAESCWNFLTTNPGDWLPIKNISLYFTAEIFMQNNDSAGKIITRYLKELQTNLGSPNLSLTNLRPNPALDAGAERKSLQELSDTAASYRGEISILWSPTPYDGFLDSPDEDEADSQKVDDKAYQECIRVFETALAQPMQRLWQRQFLRLLLHKKSLSPTKKESTQEGTEQSEHSTVIKLMNFLSAYPGLIHFLSKILLSYYNPLDDSGEGMCVRLTLTREESPRPARSP